VSAADSTKAALARTTPLWQLSTVFTIVRPAFSTLSTDSGISWKDRLAIVAYLRKRPWRLFGTGPSPRPPGDTAATMGRHARLR
jgi:hypothetical protein